jgi:hypothetical protein
VIYVRNSSHGIFLKVILIFIARQPPVDQGLLIIEIHHHTHTHHTRYDSSGRVFSPLQRPLPNNTQHSQETDIHAPGGIRTCNPSKRAAADECNLYPSIFISWPDFLQDWEGRPLSDIHWPTTWQRRPRVADEASRQYQITREINSEIQWALQDTIYVSNNNFTGTWYFSLSCVRAKPRVYLTSSTFGRPCTGYRRHYGTCVRDNVRALDTLKWQQHRRVLAPGVL